jgi:hypothetical protein
MTDDDRYAETYLSLRMIGEHVLSAARYAGNGRIGLAVVAGGIATPADGPRSTWAGVIDGELVVSDDSGRRATAITTLAAAGDFVGVTPGAPTSVYSPTTACSLDAPLPVDRAALARVTDWYGRVDAALRLVVADTGDDAAITLWPEHFDVATRLGEVNYGGLGGDSGIGTPYAYVGPATDLLPAAPAGFWNAAFGAVVTEAEATSVEQLAAFFRRGRVEAERLQR